MATDHLKLIIMLWGFAHVDEHHLPSIVHQPLLYYLVEGFNCGALTYCCLIKEVVHCLIDMVLKPITELINSISKAQWV